MLEEEIIRELETLPTLSVDFITLSGNGEPTLAKNLGHVLNAFKRKGYVEKTGEDIKRLQHNGD